MSDLVVTAAGAGRVAESVQQFTGLANEALAEISPVRLTTGGKLEGADGSGAGTADVIGVAVRPGGAATGQACTVLRHGVVEGLDLSGLAYGAPVYLSDTKGALADAAGTVSVKIGNVVPAHANRSGSPDKLLLVDIT